MAKTITFVLPGSSGNASGGSRIVYEYANRLAQKGHRVCVVHAPITRIDPDWKMLIKALVRYPQRCLDRSYRPDQWCTVDPRVKVRWVPVLSKHFVPDADIVIATAWKTAEWITRYPKEKGRKFYFIQGYEDWDGPAARVDATWTMPLRKIVIARWLQKMAHSMGEYASYVPNAIDHNTFYMAIQPEKREPLRLLMLYHTHPWKGCSDGLQAIEILKRKKPGLQVTLFGVVERPQSLPSWIEYHCNPTKEELAKLYNTAALFLAPSHSEGWGLTAFEAMACGAAVVATDNTGHREFAVDGETATLVQPKEIQRMAHALAELMEYTTRRVSLATCGVNAVKAFTWENSVRRFEDVLLEVNHYNEAENTEQVE